MCIEAKKCASKHGMTRRKEIKAGAHAGSVSIEAVLTSATVIFLFLTLTVMLHMLTARIILERAVRSTVNILAQNAYAVRVYNETEQYVLDSAIGKLGQSEYRIFRDRAETEIAEQVLYGFLVKAQINTDRLKTECAVLPEKYGIGSENIDYVELTVKYDMSDISIPFFGVMGSVTVTGRQKAWLEGNGNAGALKDILKKTVDSLIEKGVNKIFNDGEDGKNEAKSETVYITDYGTRYHRNGCSSLRKSKKAIDRSRATALGYLPCRMCVLKTAKMIGKPTAGELLR